MALKAVFKVVTFIAVRNESALYRATIFQNSEKVKKLIEAGADPNEPGVNGMLPLGVAAGGGDTKTLKALLAGKADSNGRAPPFHAPPLSLAAFAGKLETIRMLLEWGADPELKDNTGQSPIDYLRESNFLSSDTVRKIEGCLSDSIKKNQSPKDPGEKVPLPPVPEK